MSDTRANIEVTASSNRLAAGLRAAMARVQTFSRGVGASMKRVGESAVGTAIGNVAGNLAGRGIDFVTDQAKSVVDFEDKLTRLQINAGKTSVEMDAFRQKARKLSTEVGLSANEILEGTVAYVDLTGDVNGAGDAMGSFARIAQASGSSVADISTAAAALKQSFNLDPKQIENTFSGMIAQGKAGAVTLKDFAGQLSSLAPKWAKFNEASSEKGIAEFGAAFQVARQGFGSAAEAATGMEALMGGLVTHAKDLRKFGKIDVFEHHKDGSKSLKTFEQILASIEKSKLVKDPELMGKALGGRKEATDTLNVLLRARANLTATGNEYTDLVAKGMDYGSSTRDLVTYLDSSSGKMKVTWQTLQDSIAQALTPDRIQSFTEAIEKAVAALGPLLTGLGKIGDFLGGLKKAGSDIRGAITGEGHMTTMDTVRAMAGDDQASLKKANVMAASRYTAIRAADSPLARQKLGIKAESSLELARQYANAQGPGAAAKRAAAKKYFKESGQKADDWEVAGGPSTGPANPAALMKIGLDLLGELKKITGNTKGAGKAEVKIENNTVARANKKATDPARRP